MSTSLLASESETSSLAYAQAVGLVLETLFFGIYIVVFTGSAYIVFSIDAHGRHAPRSGMNLAMRVALCILFASITTHWIVDVVRFFRAFIFKQHGGPVPYFAFLSDPTNIVKTGLYGLECVIADSIMVLRLHYVWGRSYLVCLFPALTTLSFAVTGTAITYQFVIIKPDVDVFASECGRWIFSGCALTVVTNLYSTSLIAYKMWSVLQPLRRLGMVGSIPHKRILQIIAESAAIYLACTLTTFVTYLCNSNSQFPSVDVTSPIIGIVFCLIIVRVHILGHGNTSRSFDPSANIQFVRSLTITATAQTPSQTDGDSAPLPVGRKKSPSDDMDGESSRHQA